MIIHRKIRVKIIVTPEFKKQLVLEIQEGIQKLEAEISFIEQRAKKTVTELTLKASPQVQTVREQLELEKRKREEARAGLLEQMKKISSLEDGTEVLQGEIEGPVEIKVGDNWDNIFNKEIVIKDGIIVDVR